MKFWLTGLLLCAVINLSWAGGPNWLDKIGTNTATTVEEKPNISLQLISESDGLTPQAENRLAIVIDHHDGWHTYWRMPGDTGLPTTFSFTKPQDVHLTEPVFPIPERIETSGMTSYGYSSRTILPFEAKIPRFPSGYSANIGVHVEYLACKTVCVPGKADLQIKLPYRPASKLTAKIPRFPSGYSANIGVHVEYLACKTVCVPGKADLQIKLPYRPASKLTGNAPLIQKAVKLLPEQLDNHHITAVFDEQRLLISIPASEVKVREALDFFPLDEDILQHAEKPLFRHTADGSAQLILALNPQFATQQHQPSALRGVLTGDGGPEAGGWAIEAVIPLKQGNVSEVHSLLPHGVTLPVPESTVSVGTLTALLFAFLGGLILNLMPCVFPILSLKFLELFKGYQSGKSLLPHGTAFTAGVMLTMTLLASTLLLLRAFGTSLGWGFQLQSAWVVTVLLLLFVAIAVNLFGVFEFTAGSHLVDSRFGTSLGWGFQLQSAWVVTVLLLLFVAIAVNLFGVFEFTAGSHLVDSRMVRQAPSAGNLSSFITGVLTVIVASPCTAPFMGAALGYAVTQPAMIALLIFWALGIGMALPWFALCLWPAWIKHLPKPGPWMNTFKKVMAIPILCTVLWLGWVLSKQVTLNGMLLMGCAAGAISIFLWLLGREQWGRGKNRSLMGVMLLVMMACVSLIGSGNFDRRGSVAGEGDWSAWNQHAVVRSLSEGRPVFVDMTAAWCVTCQANKISTLNREEVQSRFKALNYTLLYGDWTNRDPEITEFLATFGRSGVPLYLIYRTDGTVDVLPELLTPSIVLQALENRQTR